MGKALFKKGQRCLIPHTDQHYVAHIMRAQKREEGYFYLVHYDGWSKKYDEWVEESGLVKYNEELLKASMTGEGEGGPGAERSVRKRKAEGGGMEVPVDEKALPLQLRLHMPPLLKKIVLDDHDQVTHACRLQPLPRRPSVRQILDSFQQGRELVGEGVPDVATAEMVNGLLSYFDQGLRQLLLYHQEVQQYDEVVSGGVSPSAVYGGEHLVRLLVKLPELVPVASMGAQNVVTLEARLHDLMAQLVEKQGQLFLPSSAYVPNPHVQQPLPLPPLPAPAAAVG